MNVRKLLDWRKLLIYSHRWLGIFFGLLFFAWFVSGIAFMYWSMPSLTAEERLAHQDFVDLSKATLSPIEAAATALVDPGGLRIEMRGDRPVYRISGFPVYADTGEPAHFPVDAEQAVDIIRKWVPGHAATVRYDARLVESDQWTLQAAQSRQLPLHRIALDDEADTYYYVAEDTGNIAMKTDRESRYLDEQKTWLYLDPHRGTMSKLEWIDRVDRWTYAALHEFDFPWLYERRPHWDIVLILASIGGAVLSFTTLWPTCRRLARHARRFARMLRSSPSRQISRVGAD